MSKVDPRAIIEADKKHVWHHLTQHKVYEDKDPLFIVEGKGLRVKDINGKEYLDAVSGGVWTVNVGYGRKEIAQAVSDQLTKLCFFANSYGSIPTAKFAEKLIRCPACLACTSQLRFGRKRRRPRSSARFQAQVRRKKY